MEASGPCKSTQTNTWPLLAGCDKDRIPKCENSVNFQMVRKTGILMTLFCQVLNCIVDMVEKTRRSVSVLRRCQESDREELNYWKRRSSEQEDPRKGGSGSTPFSKTHSPQSAETGGSQRSLNIYNNITTVLLLRTRILSGRKH